MGYHLKTFSNNTFFLVKDFLMMYIRGQNELLKKLSDTLPQERVSIKIYSVAIVNFSGNRNCIQDTGQATGYS